MTRHAHVARAARRTALYAAGIGAVYAISAGLTFAVAYVKYRDVDEAVTG